MTRNKIGNHNWKTTSRFNLRTKIRCIYMFCKRGKKDGVNYSNPVTS